jgi:ADP-ribose pyrophosphatase YjhB (NUDIX family)
MLAERISIDSAKSDKLFYFVANAVVFRPVDRRCLILKRDEREKVHPGKFAVPGGKLEWADMDLAHPTRMNGDVIDFEGAVEKLLVREIREEAGVEVAPEMKYLNSVAFVRPDGIPVVLVKFAMKHVSGHVKVEEGSFTDFAWVNGDEVSAYDCIDGIADEIKNTITLFS